MTKPVIQLKRTGCEIASVTVLAGVSYTAAKRAANRMGIHAMDSRLWSETSHVRQRRLPPGMHSQIEPS